MFLEQAKDYVSVSGKDVFSSVEKTVFQLKGASIPFEARTTLYPGFTLPMLMALCSAFPPLPCWRLNFFRMPKEKGEETRQRLEEQALSLAEITAYQTQLREMQPNLKF